MDMSLPGIDGWEATRLIKGTVGTRAIPIIALTAHAMASDREKAMQAGCDDYDTKPVDINRLLAKIQKWLSSVPGVAPAVAQAPAPLEEEIVTEAPPTSTGPAIAKILIVEDNEMNRDMLSRRLERRNYEVVIAIDGEHGVAIAKSEMPDLILMDMSLPGLDGWEATKLLRAAAETRTIPIIALTAHAMSSDREKALESGCNDYDTKPVEIDRLLAKIEALLKGRRKM